MSLDFRPFATMLALMAIPSPALGAGPDSPRGELFLDRVRPLLESRCVSCHGPAKQEGGLRLDSASGLLEGGDGGPAIVVGDPASSRLVRAVRHEAGVPKMPPKERLKEDQVADLAEWVREGAPWPAPGLGRPSATTRRIGDAWSDPENPIRRIYGGERLDLWSLRKPARTPVPEVGHPGWARTPVDRFLLASMERGGLKPSPEADRRTLIRRVTFDLIGLPPTPAEVDAFVADPAPDAYESLVDRLLASPRHGERWARSWLDVVRYSDTNGFERDEFRPAMHRYRDYVIRSLNADKPYDRFLREQLAGDEIGGGGPVKDVEEADRRIATGYLRLGPFDSTRSIFMEDAKGQDELMADLANTTGSAFLGMTMACCQCHDHKYEPLSQDDHYRFRAFFAAAKPVDDLIIEPSAEREAIDRHNAGLDSEIGEIEGRINALLAPTRKAVIEARKMGFPEEIRELLEAGSESHDDATKEKLKPFREKLNQVERKDLIDVLPGAKKAVYEGLVKQAEEIKSRKKTHATVMAMTDVGKIAPATWVFAGGDFTRPTKEVAPGFPSILDPNPATIPKALDDTTGRRLALAAWIASRDNPLTARVAVNRLWQGHFGLGLVATPNDLGYSGARPSHPELLDWLAVEFMESGWSLKAIHRLMVTSSAYRQASTGDPDRARLDPDNLRLWRQNVRRLDAESLRDALLSVSGRLLPADSGPPRWPPVPEEILEAQPAILEFRHGGADGRLQDWYGQSAETADVRSIFLVQKRSVPILFLQPFDLPDMTISCARRTVTTVAPQALALLNGPDMTRWSRAFADRAWELAGDDPARQVEQAFRLALLRTPGNEERGMALELLRRHAELYRAQSRPDMPAPDRRSLVDLCRALFNANEFAYLD